ncbi:MAG: Wzz/FepE/Etk N-terminal domain-containing protein [Pseudomonadota bacterium]
MTEHTSKKPVPPDYYQIPYGPYPMAYPVEEEINLLDMWRTLMARKWLITGLTVLATAAALAVALYMTPVYRAEVLLAPVEEEQNGAASALAQFGGLASMVGVSLGGGGSTEHTLAVLKSRAFLDEFIQDNQLLPVFFARLWDAEKQAWAVDDPKGIPSAWDAYNVFTKGLLKTSVDKKSGLITVGIEWEDPEQAAQWANQLVARLNHHQRQAAIREAEKSLAYLNEQLGKTPVVEMQQMLYRLIEAETKKIMLAKVRDEYAFKVVDPAVVPEQKIKPKRALIVVLGFIAGLMGSIFLVFFLSFIQKQKKDAQTTA